MIKIMFVCLGNICRSPMAEFLMKDLIRKKGVEDKFFIMSSATSNEEEGNPVHYGTARVLDKYGIDYSKKRAVKLTAKDYGEFDYFIGMEKANKRNMERIFNGDPEGKISLIMDYTDTPKDVADPWYTGDFEKCKTDIINGCKALLKEIQKGD